MIYNNKDNELLRINNWPDMVNHLEVCIIRYQDSKWDLIDALYYAFREFEDDFLQTAEQLTGYKEGTIRNFLTLGAAFPPEVRAPFPHLEVSDFQAIPKKLPREEVLRIAAIANGKRETGEWNREDVRDFVRQVKGNPPTHKDTVNDVLRDLYYWALVNAPAMPQDLINRVEGVL